jgi:hypothetical protein
MIRKTAEGVPWVTAPLPKVSSMTISAYYVTTDNVLHFSNGYLSPVAFQKQLKAALFCVLKSIDTSL